MIELSEAEIEGIKHEMSLYEDPGAATIEALKIVQEHRGWVSDEALEAAAKVVNVTPTQMEAVATFYNLIFRQPVGRHVIMLCDSISCYLVGYEQVRDHLKSSLGIDFGQTTEDGRFTLLPICCLGDCDQGPTMRVGEHYHSHLTPERVDAILDEYK
ncbi:NADH-quinone oxidoreductase subunit NuoE [Salinisphaera sp.]|uniref:NADH-quinone oxidoreductase subunit NuoE n=1 Tax=Salinisphaera sp. TaxID=1914330 RepID=UPI002D76E50F|nr:NADH-quinone oxidoreductase subunit NuoE [Salinisphaera sp.]HET7314827.1 NADH-quinone oxidoreductase subunit NuoE [Salinisphaera sp.]